MPYLDSQRHAYTSENYALTVTFDRFTQVSQSTWVNSFSDSHTLYMRRNSLRLYGRHQRKDRFQLCGDQFRFRHS